MNIHFFYSNTSCHSWYAVTLEALLEEDVYSSLNQKMQKSFRYIERIRIHICKDLTQYHASRFDIDFGKNSCCGHGATSVKQLHKDMLEDSRDPYVIVSERNYLRLRKAVFGIYNSTPFMDFSMVAGEQKEGIRLLDHLS